MTTTTKEWLTVPEFLDEFDIARSTFQDWRAKGTAPPCRKLPNGQLRLKRSEVNEWLESLVDNSEVAA
ncbi:helix-turn-helix transcriptional regulator [Stackebrandtia nassauensis]|uniref:Helix-turn-helix domain-containing protein n=1 Tax=Stackebrandtia nassauensis (strain DSM 44728 / CIP 108903 / NRRL B-16338 / NBRC 102104 / LLR-40K-21) TaxID=446470 RepID=D3Q398_STANL|nr:helix-turn-helix domain-containing protein [Stackebrandtia nassauensis]ADD40068.1 hypothetical protein Snas_0350 [Stackebrandtia nassauensis DSM 44728]